MKKKLTKHNQNCIAPGNNYFSVLCTLANSSSMDTVDYEGYNWSLSEIEHNLILKILRKKKKGIIFCTRNDRESAKYSA